MNIEEVEILVNRVLSSDYVSLPGLQSFREKYNLSGPYYDFLYELGLKLNSGKLLEIGTGSGGSALHFATGAVNGLVLTVDNGPGIKLSESFQIAKREAPNIHFFEANSLDLDIGGIGLMDFLFIDANHVDDDAFAEYAKFSPLVKSGGLILFDDALWIKGAWDRVELPKKLYPDLHPGGCGFGVCWK